MASRTVERWRGKGSQATGERCLRDSAPRGRPYPRRGFEWHSQRGQLQMTVASIGPYRPLVGRPTDSALDGTTGTTRNARQEKRLPGESGAAALSHKGGASVFGTTESGTGAPTAIARSARLPIRQDEVGSVAESAAVTPAERTHRSRCKGQAAARHHGDSQHSVHRFTI